MPKVHPNPHRLEAVSLDKSFQVRKVVDQVDFFVESGEVVGLLGPNGAGKTTSFYMVVGLLFPDSGRIQYDGRDITALPIHERARMGIGYLPQNMSIFRKLTVEQNLVAIMEVVGTPRDQRKDKLASLLEKFSIGHIGKAQGAALSGGERRRVEIARALISEPKFLLLDEPFAGIDPVTVHEIQAIINKLSKEDGLGVLITDHNVRETLGSCDRAYVLANGRIIEHGNSESISNSKIVKDVYLGENFRL